MEFPMSRYRLQNYVRNEAVSAEAKQRVSREIQKICKDIEMHVLRGNEHKYIYRIEGHVKNGLLQPNVLPQGALRKTVGILKELLKAIKTNFPDSTITIDPLETYIVIDWS